jgi:leucyl-tRNA synthetase
VAKLYELVTAIEKAPPSASRTAAGKALLRLIAPMMPHLAEEAHAAQGGEGLIADAAWPAVDPALLVDEEVTYVFQVNGKRRDQQSVPKGTPEDEVIAIALANSAVKQALGGQEPKRKIVVPDRLVNLVA